MEKGGGGKPHEGHPSQNHLWTPLRLVRFPPPADVVALFCLYRSPRLSTPEAHLEGSESFSGGVRCLVRFPPPHTFCTPRYHGPKIYRGSQFISPLQ